MNYDAALKQAMIEMVAQRGSPDFLYVCYYNRPVNVALIPGHFSNLHSQLKARTYGSVVESGRGMKLPMWGCVRGDSASNTIRIQGGIWLPERSLPSTDVVLQAEMEQVWRGRNLGTAGSPGKVWVGYANGGPMYWVADAFRDARTGEAISDRFLEHDLRS
jgi:hypothetical protein